MNTQKIEIDTGVEKIKIAYINAPATSKSKQSIVLLHGFMGNMLLYKPIISKLQNFANVLAIDLPGFGNSDPTNNYTLEYMSNCISKVIKSKTPNTPILLGHSIGGTISYYMASKNSNCFKAVITQGAPINIPSMSKKTQRYINLLINTFSAKGFINPAQFISSTLTHPKVTKTITKILSNHSYYNPILNTTTDKITTYSVRTIDPLVIGKACSLFDSLDITDEIRQLNIPTIALVGKQDKALIIDEFNKIENTNPNVTVRICENFVHQQMILNPDSVITEILPYLTKT